MMATNVRIKHYRQGVQINVASWDCYGKTGEQPKSASVHKRFAPDPERSAEQSRARARRAVRDIVLCNDFTHMFTLTFSKSFVDRYDAKEIYRKLSNFLRERVRNEGFLYVAVAEHHKDGAIHIHGLGRFDNMKLARAFDPKKKRAARDKQGRAVYNLVSWMWGRSHVTKLDQNSSAAANYCTEYINKDNDKIFGKWYLSARACVKKPHTVDAEPMEYNEAIDEGKILKGEQWIINPSPYLFIVQEWVEYPDGSIFEIEGWLECLKE